MATNNQEHIMRAKFIALFLAAAGLFPVAAAAQQPSAEPERPMTVGEVQMRTNLVNLDSSITQAMKQQAAVMKENEYLKKLLSDAMATCGEPCKPKPEAKKE